eukprot:5205159-Prorocentrum_lima.AAC.1
MTSSLVGSEMCIRDRCSAFHPLPLPPPVVPLVLVRVVRTSVLAYESVSYTHLTLPTICSV